MVLLGVFSGLYSIIRINDASRPITDNTVFQMHYKWTRLLLFVFCIGVSLNALIGKPIACHANTGGSGRLQTVMQTYCWISGTFTYKKYFGTPSQISENKLSSVGIGPGREDQDEKNYITYYQWVPIVLFLQGVMFYVPHWIWKLFEDHRIRRLIEGMIETKLGEKDRKHRQTTVVRYLVDSKGTNEWYAYKYILCEILNFVNVIVNIALVDRLLGGNFYTYGPKLIEYDPENPYAVDPSHYTFPKQTKCTFFTYGLSGKLQNVDALCVLPINILNEKLYAILWFWFITLALVTGINLLWRLAMLLSPALRIWMLQTKGKSRDGSHTLAITQVVDNSSFSDFFFVWLFTKNLGGLVLFDFLREYARTVTADLPPKQTPSVPIYPTLPRNSFQMQVINDSELDGEESQEDEKKPMTPQVEMDEDYIYTAVNKRRP